MKKNILKILLRFQSAIERLFSLLSWNKKDFETDISQDGFLHDKEPKSPKISVLLEEKASKKSASKTCPKIDGFSQISPQKNVANFSKNYEKIYGKIYEKSEKNFSEISSNFGLENLENYSDFDYDIFQNKYYLSKNLKVLKEISRLNSFLNVSENITKNNNSDDNFYPIFSDNRSQNFSSNSGQNFSSDFSQNLTQNFPENATKNFELNVKRTGASNSYFLENFDSDFLIEKYENIYSKNQNFRDENYVRELVDGIISEALDTSIRINGFKIN